MSAIIARLQHTEPLLSLEFLDCHGRWQPERALADHREAADFAECWNGFAIFAEDRSDAPALLV